MITDTFEKMVCQAVLPKAKQAKIYKEGVLRVVLIDLSFKTLMASIVFNLYFSLNAKFYGYESCSSSSVYATSYCPFGTKILYYNLETCTS